LGQDRSVATFSAGAVFAGIALVAFLLAR